MLDSNKVGKNNGNKGFTASVVLHLVLLLMAFFYHYKADLTPPDPPLEKTYEIDIDIPEVKVRRKSNPPVVEKMPPPADENAETSNSTKANADAGESRPLNPVEQKVEKSDPKPPAAPVETKPTPPAPKTTPAPAPSRPTPPAPTPPAPTSRPTTQAPVVTKTSDANVEAPTKETPPSRPAPSTSPSTSTKPSGGSAPSTPTKPKETGTGTVGSPTGTGNKPQSQTDGDGRGKSDAGTGLGNGKGSDVTSGTGNKSDGTGEFDGNGSNSIFGRKVVKMNYRNMPLSVSGVINLKVCIDKAGSITFLEIMPGTTISDKKILRQALSAFRQDYIYAADPSATKEQCGKHKLTLQALNGFR